MDVVHEAAPHSPRRRGHHAHRLLLAKSSRSLEEHRASFWEKQGRFRRTAAEVDSAARIANTTAKASPPPSASCEGGGGQPASIQPRAGIEPAAHLGDPLARLHSLDKIADALRAWGDVHVADDDDESAATASVLAQARAHGPQRQATAGRRRRRAEADAAISSSPALVIGPTSVAVEEFCGRGSFADVYEVVVVLGDGDGLAAQVRGCSLALKVRPYVIPPRCSSLLLGPRITPAAMREPETCPPCWQVSSYTSLLAKEFKLLRRLQQELPAPAAASFPRAHSLKLMPSASLMLLDFCPLPSLKEALNDYLRLGSSFPELVTMYYASQILQALRALHGVCARALRSATMRRRSESGPACCRPGGCSQRFEAGQCVHPLQQRPPVGALHRPLRLLARYRAVHH